MSKKRLRSKREIANTEEDRESAKHAAIRWDLFLADKTV